MPSMFRLSASVIGLRSQPSILLINRKIKIIHPNFFRASIYSYLYKPAFLLSGVLAFSFGYSKLALNEENIKSFDSFKHSENAQLFIDEIEKIVDNPSRNVIKSITRSAQEPYVRGIRLGHGLAVAVIKPGSIKEAVEVLKACVKYDIAVIPQGKNTGLTGGSVPRTKADREFAIISLTRLNKIIPIKETNKNVNQVLCYAGAGIYDLELFLKPFKREPHSVLGSIFLNPTVAGGVAFGSGGTHVRKGPAYTERALYCRIDERGKVQVVNRLGLKSEDSWENVVALLESSTSLETRDFQTSLKAHDSQYKYKVCELSDEVARFNGDTSGSSECVRSEGKVMILATIHDAFPLPEKKSVYWIGCSSFAQASELKRTVVVSSVQNLPISCEYLNKDAFDVTDQAGRILVQVITVLGIKRLGFLWDLKAKLEALPACAEGVSDKVLFYLNFLVPRPLPKKCYLIGKNYEHHVLLEMGEFGNGELERSEEKLLSFLENERKKGESIEVFKCANEKEVQSVMTFRFAVAAAFKTYNEGKGYRGISVDYALRKNDFSVPVLPFDREKNFPEPTRRLRYMHFACNVAHEDLSFPPSFQSKSGLLPTDVEGLTSMIKEALKANGIRLPAEHGHGVEYEAPPETQQRWRELDPLNMMNPGVGKTSFKRNYA